MLRSLLNGVVLMLAVLPAGQPPPVAYYNPDWSPDGSYLVFESTRDGKSAIYTIRLDGSQLQKLTDGLANDAQPRWFADAKRIVFISDRDGPSHIYVMDRDGKNQRRVTESADVDFRPDVSPQGDQITFMSRPAAGVVEYDVYVVGIKGTGRRRLTREGADDTSPVWSPDGKRIAFVSGAVINYRGPAEAIRQARATEEIVVMAADGSDPRRLTSNADRDCCVSWSGDGSRIYFTSERDGAPQIYVIDADGTNPQRVADGAVVSQPNIAPNGQYFVYARLREGVSGIYVYDRQSGAERQIVGPGQLPRIEPLTAMPQ